ncbi:MAG: hypothetical protein AAGJ81_15690 [Verrucomicrobiota bacterium]
MSIEDSPTIEHMRVQAKNMRTLLSFTGLFMGTAKKKELQKKLSEIEAGLDRLVSYRKRFSDYFTDSGWLAYDSMPTPVIEEAVDAYEKSGFDGGETVLMRFYSPDELSKRVKYSFMNSEEFRLRRPLIELAFEDYTASRYHAVVPVLLAVMDGAFNQANRRGLHTDSAEMDVWDSMTVTDGSIYKVKDVFCKGRNRTRTESIDLPYRNGILHGIDLGYANEVVAAKSWCFLSVVADWVASKNSEDSRRSKYDEDMQIPSFSEIGESMARTKALKEGCAKWIARKISKDYLVRIQKGNKPSLGTPEEVALDFMNCLTRRNYGHMADMFAPLFVGNPKTFPGQLRCQFEHLEIKRFTISSISDDAPARATVLFSVDCEGTHKNELFVSLIYQSENGESLAVGMPNGKWNVATAYLRDAESFA